MLHGESLSNFDTLCAQIGHTTSAHLKQILLGLGTYLFPIKTLSKQNRAMWSIMRRLNELKVRHYADRMTEPHDQLDIFMAYKSNEKL